MLKCVQCGKEHHHTLQFCPVTGNVLAPERLLPEGTILEGKYRVGKVLGAGGMGAVFAATHTMLNKAMAIKVMVPDMSSDKELTARLVREARAASATGHRNVANVTDMGWTDDSALFVVMEFLDGLTLQELITRDGPLSPKRVVHIATQILSGLDAVHALGIVHRDLKPENIMVVGGVKAGDEEEVKILDFGISKMVGDEGPALNLTASGLVMGTPQYMAPEQARGAIDLDHRADIYAAGAIVYTALTKRRPHSASNYNAMIAQILAGKIIPPSKLRPEIPAIFDTVVLKALALKPADRYPNALAFKKALEGASMDTGPEISLSSAELVPLNTGKPAVGHLDDGDASYDISADQLVSLAEVDGSDGNSNVGGGMNAGKGSPSLDLTQAPYPVAEVSSPDDTPRSMDVSPTRMRNNPAARQGQGDNKRHGSGVADSIPFAQASPVNSVADSDAIFSSEPSLGESSGELELDHSYAPPPEPDPGAAGETIFRPQEKSSRGSVRRSLFLLALVGALAAGGWFYRHEISIWYSGPESPVVQEKVMILVVSKPKEVDVFVDGKLREGNPIELIRSDKTHEFLIQAKGYLTKKIPVIPNRTHSVNVKLAR